MSRARAPSIPNVLPGTLADWRRTLGLHYLRLAQTSRQRRFMAVQTDQTTRMIASKASPDIVLGIKADGRLVGVVEIFKGPAQHAEIGISVEDAYQGRGLGKALFIDGLSAARQMGVRTADLYFTSENRGIRRLITAAGGCVVRHGPTCEAHIDITHYHACTDARGDGTPAFLPETTSPPALAC